MSVQIRLQPAQLNTVYTKLIYNIASTNINLPQYAFVCDIEDLEGNLISTLKQPANSQDIAVFDVSVPLRPKLSFDKTLYTEGPIGYSGSGSKSVSNTYPDSVNINSYEEFVFKFGEEYGTSPSSSVTLYNGLGAVGRPAVQDQNLILNRSTWEPWNESNYVSSSANTGSQNSLTGSLNYFLEELPSTDYVDINLRVDGVLVSFGGSGSLEWYDAPKTYKLDIISFGVSSSDYRYSMEIYDMSANQMVYQSSQGTTLPSGYVSGSVGTGGQQLDTTNFTGELGKVYGLRMNGIPTSSFTSPLFEGYYLANNFTASSDAIRSITYPLEPGNIVNLGEFPETRYWSPTINTTSGSVVGTLDRAFPTLQDLEVYLNPGLPAQQTGSFSTWDWNSNAGQLTWNGRLFMSNDPSLIISASQLSGNPDTEQRYVNKNWDSFKGISKLDYATLSYINISGSTDTVNVILRDHEDPIPPKYTAGWGSYFGSPALPGVVSGSDTFVTIPAGYQNMLNYDNSISGSITGSSDDWDLLQVESIYLPGGGAGARYGIGIYRRDEPCEYETRSNFAFINAYGVWDFIGMNTPTNKNAVITERNEFFKPSADYNTNGAYSVYNRGFEQYFLSQNYRYQITSKPIIDRISTIRGEFSNADYYSELIHSPNVMLQVGTTFVPINITNSSFRYRTNIKSQKVFQVTIQYEMSNKPRSRT